MGSLVDSRATHKVSSVLNKDVKNFGKQFMFDGSEETCWNSAEGSPQHVTIDFHRLVVPEGLKITFQGGFAGKSCFVEAAGADGVFAKVADFAPQDSNLPQVFPIATSAPVQFVRVVFATSTDLFGRVTVYNLAITGSEAP